MGAAKVPVKVPVAYVVRADVDELYEFDNDEERRVYQMPPTGENFVANWGWIYGKP